MISPLHLDCEYLIAHAFNFLIQGADPIGNDWGLTTLTPVRCPFPSIKARCISGDPELQGRKQ